MRVLVGCILAAALAAASAAGDEIDDLAKQIKPEPRFRDYEPDFRVERRTFTFHHVKGPVEKTWWVVRDGEKVVALHRSGDFNLLALTPEMAETELDMPTGRYHLDTQRGPTLCTHQFLKPVRMHGSIQLQEVSGPQDEWVGGGETLTLVRSLETDGRITRHAFTLSVDPIFGYRIDGRYDVRFKEMPTGKAARWVGPTFTPGCYPPWPKDRIYDRTVHCPGFGIGGYRGWANNLVCMDRADANRERNSWRDGGFIAFLSRRDGWSVCRTRVDGGGDLKLPVCNAHNDFHVRIPVPPALPKDEKGWYHFQAHHRLMGLPPEMTTFIWDRMRLIQQGARGVFVSIGEPEGFEDQPMALTEPERGITWTAHPPEITTRRAHSGKKSAVLRRSTWPNLPQVSCRPNSKFRLQAWFQVVPWTKEEVEAAKARDAARRGKMKERGRDLPPSVDWDDLRAEAWITAHVYEWSPHSRNWLVRQRTPKATADTAGWQRVALQFDTPRWDPCVNIVFEVKHGTAYLDDFSLMEVTDPAKAPPNVSVHPAAEDELRDLECRRWPTWTSEPKRFEHHYDRTETCYITEGEAVVHTDTGTFTLEPGHLVTFPKGLDCTWEVREAIRKHYRLQ